MALIIIITGVFCVYYLCAVLFLRRGLLSVVRAVPRATPAGNHTFSIVIAARNEERDLRACLDSVVRQSLDASRYEVIVVDDRSTDATVDIARECADRHANLTLVRIAETPAGMVPKKHAIMQGIDRSRHEIIVLTDADCIVPPTWLAAIDRMFDGRTGLVQGITAYHEVVGMGRLFYQMQALEFIAHNVVAAAAIGAGLPLNANANNLSFRKDAYREIGGYGGAGAIVSGDDDMLLQKFHRSGSWEIRFMTDPQGAVTTRPTPTMSGIFEQRKRWGSVTVHYGVSQIALLAGIFIFYLAIFAAFAGGFWDVRLFAWCAVLLAVKLAGECLLLLPGLRMSGHSRLRRVLPPASLLQLPLTVVAVAAGVFGRFSWKGRRFGRTVR
jgi:cellulose synthase/poly-beta-1,6-N-acetylglucosamine synthase-like glycosyltransferase